MKLSTIPINYINQDATHIESNCLYLGYQFYAYDNNPRYNTPTDSGFLLMFNFLGQFRQYWIAANSDDIYRRHASANTPAWTTWVKY